MRVISTKSALTSVWLTSLSQLKTVDALMRLDLAAGVDVQISLG